MITITNLSREKLYEMVWNTPLSKLAPEFGLCDKGLAKKCIKHKFPTPLLVYWPKCRIDLESHQRNINTKHLISFNDGELSQIARAFKP